MIRFYINYTIQNNETNINNETEFKELNMHTINYKDIKTLSIITFLIVVIFLFINIYIRFTRLRLMIRQNNDIVQLQIR